MTNDEANAKVRDLLALPSMTREQIAEYYHALYFTFLPKHINAQDVKVFDSFRREPVARLLEAEAMLEGKPVHAVLARFLDEKWNGEPRRMQIAHRCPTPKGLVELLASELPKAITTTKAKPSAG